MTLDKTFKTSFSCFSSRQALPGPHTSLRVDLSVDFLKGSPGHESGIAALKFLCLLSPWVFSHAEQWPKQLTHRQVVYSCSCVNFLNCPNVEYFR